MASQRPSAVLANVQRPETRETRHGHPRVSLSPCPVSTAQLMPTVAMGMARPRRLSARSIWEWKLGWNRVVLDELDPMRRSEASAEEGGREGWSSDRCSGWGTIEKAARLTDLAWPLGELLTPALNGRRAEKERSLFY